MQVCSSACHLLGVPPLLQPESGSPAPTGLCLPNSSLPRWLPCGAVEQGGNEAGLTILARSRGPQCLGKRTHTGLPPVLVGAAQGVAEGQEWPPLTA